MDNATCQPKWRGAPCACHRPQLSLSSQFLRSTDSNSKNRLTLDTYGPDQSENKESDQRDHRHRHEYGRIGQGLTTHHWDPQNSAKDGEIAKEGW